AQLREVGTGRHAFGTEQCKMLTCGDSFVDDACNTGTCAVKHPQEHMLRCREPETKDALMLARGERVGPWRIQLHTPGCSGRLQRKQGRITQSLDDTRFAYHPPLCGVCEYSRLHATGRHERRAHPCLPLC